MSIKYVVLGYLSWQPMTGYHVKKLIADSEILPWTASNNQIYQALVDLHNDGWVTKSIEEQVGSPNRHVYTITDAGIQALRLSYYEFFTKFFHGTGKLYTPISLDSEW